GSLLDAARAAVVSCPAASLGTTEAAWASFTSIATPDRALVLVTTVNCGAAQFPITRHYRKRLRRGMANGVRLVLPDQRNLQLNFGLIVSENIPSDPL